MNLHVRVYGEPKGQPRPRAFAKPMGNGKFSARVYDAGTAEGWKSLIADAVRPHLPSSPIPKDVGVLVDATFLFARPGKLNRKKDPAERIPHLTKPDRDNLDKALLDCLTQVGLLSDDKQVFDGSPRKFYVAKGERPGVELRISIPSQHTQAPIAREVLGEPGDRPGLPLFSGRAS